MLLRPMLQFVTKSKEQLLLWAVIPLTLSCCSTLSTFPPITQGHRYQFNFATSYCPLIECNFGR